jgi:hypothetical protein
VKDGIIDESNYLKSSIKILVIMKETYGSLDYWDNDLRKFLQEGGRSQTWNNIVRWTYGLQNINKDTNILWTKVKDINNDIRIKQLKNIASINLKKIPGGAFTIKSELNNEAKKDIGLLKKQVELYSPDIILCGGQQVGTLIHEMKLFGEFDFENFDKIRLAKINNSTFAHKFQ